MKKITPPSDSAAAVLEMPANGGTARKTKNRLSELPRAQRSDANGHTDANLNEILRALTAVKKGEFGERLPLHWSGVSGKIASPDGADHAGRLTDRVDQAGDEGVDRIDPFSPCA